MTVNSDGPLGSFPGNALNMACLDMSSTDASHDCADLRPPCIANIFSAVRRMGLTCQIPTDRLDIGWPTNVQHVSHVTFDRLNGFLGLPIELQMEVPRRAPSASASVFGVSPESMQCSYDQNGNSIPTILLCLQERLYDQGGLQVEGVFRVNAENSQEEQLRAQLNQGYVPHNINIHCLAGLIKSWFRELPQGVLDTLSPEQVMQCDTEEKALVLLKALPPVQMALLDWAINLMADVVQEEEVNKMNAYNIAMVFAPNMTQMSDPLTALTHAIQVMNLLKTLILKTLRDRKEAMLDPSPLSYCSEPPTSDGKDSAPKEMTTGVCAGINTSNDHNGNQGESMFINLINERQFIDDSLSACDFSTRLLGTGNDDEGLSLDIGSITLSTEDGTNDSLKLFKVRRGKPFSLSSGSDKLGTYGESFMPGENEKEITVHRIKNLNPHGEDFMIKEILQCHLSGIVSEINARSGRVDRLIEGVEAW